MSELSADDLRYLSMIAWRQGTRRAEDIATRVDAVLAARAGPGVDDDSWIPPYARARPTPARRADEQEQERERARQAEAHRHFDVV